MPTTNTQSARVQSWAERLVEAMREYLIDCQVFPDEDTEAVLREAPAKAIIAYVQLHYVGGVAQFIADGRS